MMEPVVIKADKKIYGTRYTEIYKPELFTEQYLNW